METKDAFISASRHYLQRVYLPKIERCLDELSDDDVWWRPNDRSNGIGNLILHLVGNVRQYVVSGAGGAPDVRLRDEEFAARQVVSKHDLRTMLRQTLADVDAVLARLDPSELERTITVQGRQITVFAAIYHAVEHFSMHTGQIIYAAKQLRDVDLSFYSFAGGVVQRHY